MPALGHDCASSAQGARAGQASITLGASASSTVVASATFAQGNGVQGVGEGVDLLEDVLIVNGKLLGRVLEHIINDVDCYS